MQSLSPLAFLGYTTLALVGYLLVTCLVCAFILRFDPWGILGEEMEWFISGMWPVTVILAIVVIFGQFVIAPVATFTRDCMIKFVDLLTRKRQPKVELPKMQVVNDD